MVLDVVIRSPGKLLGDVCPSVAMVLMQSNKYCLFIVSPFSFLQLRIKMIDESFPTLLALSTRKMCGDLCPLSTIEGALLF